MLVAIETAGIIQHIFQNDFSRFPFISLIFMILILIEKLKMYLCVKTIPKSKSERLLSLGKKVKSGELVDLEDCPICFEKMEKISTLCITNCNHVYHNCCLNKWRNQQNDCPLCRTNICSEMELPRSKSPTNLFDYQYYQNSFSSLKQFLDEADGIVVSLNDENAFILHKDDTITSI